MAEHFSCTDQAGQENGNGTKPPNLRPRWGPGELDGRRRWTAKHEDTGLPESLACQRKEKEETLSADS